ncbi:MAG: tripartite tricarboxylate transporter substrate binding protein [Rhodocyclaceae bacterium]|nr:tripartite tricarboxylate transporter substrate binding protein [Rhodocyclaceae bacterium]
MKGCKQLFAVLGAGVVALATAPAFAEEAYPVRPVQIVVGYPAGGSTDIAARLLAEKLTKELGQNFVVDNKAGASGQLAAAGVARAEPSGYTLFMTASPEMTIVVAVGKAVPYNPLKDFQPISLVVRAPHMLVVNPAVPAANLKELVALARKNPAKLNYASFGAGTSNHLGGELFKMVAGVDVTHIPYKGGAPAITDLIGGRVDMMFESLAVVLPHVRAGKLRGLAIATAERSPLAPEIPTFTEAGIDGFVTGTWFGLVAPAGTPRPVVEKLAGAVQGAIAAPEVKSTFEQRGLVPVGNSPQDFKAFIASEVERWSAVAKKAAIEIR